MCLHRTNPLPLIPLPNPEPPARTRLPRPLALQPEPVSPPNHSSAPHSSAPIPNLQHGRGSRGRSPSNPNRCLHRTIPLPLIPLPQSRTSSTGAAPEAARPPTRTGVFPPNHSPAPHSSAPNPEPPARTRLPRPLAPQPEPVCFHPSFLCPNPEPPARTRLPRPLALQPEPVCLHRTIPLPLIPLPPIPNLQHGRGSRGRSPSNPNRCVSTEPFLCPSFLCPKSRTSSTGAAPEAARPPTRTGVFAPNHSPAPHSSAPIPNLQHGRGSRGRSPSNPNRCVCTEPIPCPSFLCQIPNLQHGRGSRGHSPSNPNRCLHRTIPLPLIPLPQSRTSSTGAAPEAARPPTRTGVSTEPFPCPSFLCPNPEPPARTRLPRPLALQPEPVCFHRTIPLPLIPLPQSRTSSTDAAPEAGRPPTRTGVFAPNHSPAPHSSAPNPEPPARTRLPRPLALQPEPVCLHRTIPLPLIPLPQIPNLQHGRGSRGHSPSNPNRCVSTEPFPCPSFLCPNPEPPARTRLPRPVALQPEPVCLHRTIPLPLIPLPQIPNLQHGRGSRGRSPSNPNRCVCTEPFLCPSFLCPKSRTSSTDAAPEATRPPTRTGVFPPNHSPAPHSSAPNPEPPARTRLPRPLALQPEPVCFPPDHSSRSPTRRPLCLTSGRCPRASLQARQLPAPI